MTSQQTISAWITDGSSVRFTDTDKLKTKPKTLLSFLTESYEGLFDQKVFVGKGDITWQEGGHDAELEWALIFPQPIQEVDISEGTQCILQGMIEGKNLSNLLGGEAIPWGPASIGNNVIATQDSDCLQLTGGVPIELGALKGKHSVATMKLSFLRINGSKLPERIVDSTVLKNFPVVEYVRELASCADKLGLADCRVVNLGANGSESGYVNKRFRQAGGLLGAITHAKSWKTLFKDDSVGMMDEVADQVRHWLIDTLIDDDEGMARGESAELNVFDKDNNPVGNAVLHAE